MFYDTFHKLCESKGVTDSRACLDMGFSRSYAAKMKNKKGAPSMDKLSTMANYFGVTVDYLLREEKENAPGSDAESEVEKALALATPAQRELINSILDMNENQLLFVKELVEKAKKLVE